MEIPISYKDATLEGAEKSAADGMHLNAARQFYMVEERKKAVEQYQHYIAGEGGNAAILLAAELLFVADEIGDAEFRTQVENHCIDGVSKQAGAALASHQAPAPVAAPSDDDATINTVALTSLGKSEDKEITGKGGGQESEPKNVTQTELFIIALRPAVHALYARGDREKGVWCLHQLLKNREMDQDWRDALALSEKYHLYKEAEAYRAVVERML